MGQQILEGNAWNYVSELDFRRPRGDKRGPTFASRVQMAASRVLRDGCYLRVGTIDYPLDRRKVAMMIVRAGRIIGEHTLPPADAKCLYALVRYAEQHHSTRQQKAAKDFAARLSATSYRTLLKYAR